MSFHHRNFGIDSNHCGFLFMLFFIFNPSEAWPMVLLPKFDNGQIFYWSCQTCSCIGQLFVCLVCCPLPGSIYPWCLWQCLLSLSVHGGLNKELQSDIVQASICWWSLCLKHTASQWKRHIGLPSDGKLSPVESLDRFVRVNCNHAHTDPLGCKVSPAWKPDDWKPALCSGKKTSPMTYSITWVLEPVF